MANPFITAENHEDIETAILLDNAKQCDLSTLRPEWRDAVAFTEGKHIFINSDDNLSRILPNYNEGMLKWLLWHERYHIELKHHPRYFRFLRELRDSDLADDFKLTKSEVNIIMDILVHDSLARMFPELVETAISNLAQMRNRNSLGYTFTSNNLEDMLDEFARHKRGEDEEKDEGGDGEGEGEPEDSEDEDEGDSKGKDSKTPEDDKKKKDTKKKKDSESTEGKDDKKEHSEGKGEEPKSDGKKDKPEDGKPEIKDEPREDDPEKSEPPAPEPEHDKTDWSKLADRDDTEFIDKDEGDYLLRKIETLKRKKFKLGRLAQTLNGLATTKKERTYAVPSYCNLSRGVILKGRRPGKTALYLVFDASGSMGDQLQMFKEVISQSIPHAMDVPCEWFAGHNEHVRPYKTDRYDGYFKSNFKDMMHTRASSGYDDDGDRTIELCLLAEQKGYSPIGVTDGGGRIYNPENVKKLKRTILVGQNKDWLIEVQKLNPSIQILDV